MKLIQSFGITVVALCTLSAPAFGAGHETFKVSEFTFKSPAAWKWVDITPGMRAAQFAIEDEKTKGKCEVIFYYFGQGGGGGTKANVDRWMGQFSDSSN